MDILLEVAPGLSRSHIRQFLDWRLQEFHYVLFNLFAQARVLQRLSQFGLLDVGESAAQWTLHEVIVNHGYLLVKRILRVPVPAVVSAAPLEDGIRLWSSDNGLSG
jgi:hypothetical protein